MTDNDRTTQQKVFRLFQLWKALRAREMAAAQVGDYPLACLYYRATFRASCLIVALHNHSRGRYLGTALQHNEALAAREPERGEHEVLEEQQP